MVNLFIHTEIKINGGWHHHCEIFVRDNHKLCEKFGLDLGLGNKPIISAIKNKYVPDDITYIVAECIDDALCIPSENGEKKIGWMNRFEIQELIRITKKFPYVYNFQLPFFKGKEIIEHNDEIRLIYYFVHE